MTLRATVVWAALGALVLVARHHPAHAHLIVQPDSLAPWSLSPLMYEFNGRALADEELPLRLVFVGEPPAGMSATDIEEAARRSAQTWDEVPCSHAVVEYSGRRASFDDVREGEVPFAFGSPTDESFCLPPGLIAFTPFTCPIGRVIFLNSQDFAWSGEPRPFEQLDPELERSTVDVQSALTHEIGHVLGLAHTVSDGAATMTPRYLVDGGQRTLAADDKFGLCALYPSGESECRTGRDCPGNRCVSSPDTHAHHGVRVCEEERGQVGYYCALDLLYCPGKCQLDSPAAGIGYCTEACEEDADCPTYFVCDVFEGDDSPTCVFTGVGEPEPSRCATSGHRAPGQGLALTLAVLAFALVVARRSWTLAT